MKTNEFEFDIGDLVRKDQGTRRGFDLDQENTLDFDKAKPISNLTAKGTFMLLDNGIHVYIEDLNAEFEFECDKCTTGFKKNINVEKAERVFDFEKRDDSTDTMDEYYVDIKQMTVDLSDFLRQEIILHFPTIRVCSNSCKGLCQKCGANLNKTSCKCDKSDDNEKPLSALKELFKD